MNYKLIRESIKENLDSILDVGAHQGLFTKEMRYEFPYARYHMIEANEHCEPYLKQIGFVDYTICTLSNKEKLVTYYTNKSDALSTGNSYYKELTEHFALDNCVEVSKQATTLDKLFKDVDFNLIKIDTQGSELDILRGGEQLVQRAKYIILECSIAQYNEGSPLIDEVMQYMSQIGFKPLVDVGNHIYQGQLCQSDWLFARV